MVKYYSHAIFSSGGIVMLRIANAPIYKFIEFVNQFYPTDDDVAVLVIESDNKLLKDGNGVGYYYRKRNGEESNVIILADCLNYRETIEVLAHEFTHHRMWTKKMDEEGSYDDTHSDNFWELCAILEERFYEWLEKDQEEI